MADPYETLGVRRDAGPKEMKAAHRRAARATHPDAGGDAAAFDAVQKAYALLSCPERRARYDRDGDAGEPRPAGGGPLFELLCGALTAVLQPLVERGFDPGRADVPAAMKRWLAERRAGLDGVLKGAARAEQAVRAVAARLSRKPGAGAEDLLGAACRLQLEGLAKQQREARGEQGLIDQAVALLDGYAYRQDTAPAAGGWVLRGDWESLADTLARGRPGGSVFGTEP